MSPLFRTALQQYWKTPLEAVKARDNQDKAIRPPLPTPRQGSIIIVIATDLPLDSQELRQLAERAGIGIADTGSSMSTTSGDFAVAFSTANPLHIGDAIPGAMNGSMTHSGISPALTQENAVHPDDLSPIFRATVEAVTEAQLNAITAAHTNQ